MKPPDPMHCVITKSIAHQLPDVNAVRIIAETFGLPSRLSQTLYDGLQLAISPGQIIAIVGPSGAGKSVLLKEIAAQFPQAVQLPHKLIARSQKPAINVLRGGSLADKLKTLSICGLADALALVTPAKFLSGGQQYRLALAAALHRVAAVPAARRAGVSPAINEPGASATGTNQPPSALALILADEFAANLDLPTAYLLCRQMRRLIAPATPTRPATPIAMVLATPRTEILDALQPDKIILKPLQAQAAIFVPRKRRTAGPWHGHPAHASHGRPARARTL